MLFTSILLTLYGKKALEAARKQGNPAPEVRGRINALPKIGPYFFVLADFELVFALALALDWLNSVLPSWAVRRQVPQ